MKLIRIKFNHVLISALTAVSLLTGLATAAHADPIRLESENIVLYGDVDPDAAHKIVTDLEIYRRTIFAMVNKEPTPADVKLTIYGFGKDKTLSRFFGKGGPAGLYTNAADGPIFITGLKKSKRAGSWEEQVAKHEFSHHVLHAIVADQFPRWYDEGFANYLSTFKVEDDLITVGAPTADHGQVLQDSRYRLMDPKDVFRSIRLYPWAKRGEGGSQMTSAFYAQSWLYVHYMQNHPEYGGAVPAYLKALKSGMEPLSAFESAFKITPKKFHILAKNYFAADAFPVLQFKAQPAFLAVEIDMTEMSMPALELEILRAQGKVLSEENEADYAKRLERAAAGMGDTPKIAMARARLAVLQEDFDTAVAASNTVLKTDPADLRALRMVGDAYMGRSQAAAHKDLRDTHLHRYTDNADLQTALGHFRTVLADRPKDRHAIYALLTAYGRSSLPTTPQLMAATRIYEDEYFEGRSPSTMVHFANIYARNGDEARACSYYGAARSIVDSVKTRYETDIKARLAQFEATHGSLCQS